MPEYIIRDAAMNFALDNTGMIQNATEEELAAMKAVLNYVQKIPVADVAPVVRGRWLEPWPYTTGGICDQCETHSTRKTRFCHYCGARMDVKEKNKDG